MRGGIPGQGPHQLVSGQKSPSRTRMALVALSEQLCDKRCFVEVVAIYLMGEAPQRPVAVEKDLFGRSAFNRFYYAAYLTVRAALLAGLGECPKSHSDVPDFLLGKVSRGLTQGEQRARRVSDTELAKLCSRARTSARELAEILKEGYSVRVTADYFPEVPVIFEANGEFGLNTVHISKARSWPPKADAMCKSICIAWRQANA